MKSTSLPVTKAILKPWPVRDDEDEDDGSKGNGVGEP
jgi:hypothetical protein